MGNKNILPELVSLAQADGDELEVILRHSQGLPLIMCGSKENRDIALVQTWFGDHAKFVAEIFRRKG